VSKSLKFELSTCEELSIVPTIRLLLQTQNIRLHLCNYSSIVEILKYKIGDNQTSFLKINKYFGKKNLFVIVNVVYATCGPIN
jgi:hypothetical protein